MGYSQSADESILEMQNRQHQINSTAKQLWEEAGRPSGRDLDFWLAAERMIDRREMKHLFVSAFPPLIMEW